MAVSASSGLVSAQSNGSQLAPARPTDSAIMLQARSVWVSNLPREATEPWLRMLFSNAGTVDKVELSNGANGTAFATVVFASPVHAQMALLFNGRSAMGRQIRVQPANVFPPAPQTASPLPLASTPAQPNIRPMADTPRSAHPATYIPRFRPPEGPSPSHKNLYILNLPLDATTDQLTALFSNYGQVVHCVILAMLDAQARRRGFIDMKTPSEAKEAIEGLNGFVWHGYPIEVSYAIVQRSGGPLDQSPGRSVIKRNVPRNRFNTGPRRVPSDSALQASMLQGTSLLNRQTHSGQAQRSYGLAASATPPGSTGSSEAGGMGLSAAPEKQTVTDPCTLIISGLDPVAILDDEDFRHALEPYGAIAAASLSRDSQGISRGYGVVTFNSEADATRAREGVHNKVISGRRLEAHNLVYPRRSAPAMSPPQPFSPYGAGSPAYPTPRLDSPVTAPTSASTPAWNSSVAAVSSGLGSGNATPFPYHQTHLGMPSRHAYTPPALSSSTYALAEGGGFDGVAGLPGFGTELYSTPLARSGPLDAPFSLETATSGFGTSQPPLFRPHGPSRPVEIRPDPNATPQQQPQNPRREQLAEPFVPSASPSSKPQSPPANDRAQSPPRSKTPSLTYESWRGGAAPERSRHGLESFSPASNFSIGSTASTNSQLNTPESMGRGKSLGLDADSSWSTKSGTGVDFDSIMMRPWSGTADGHQLGRGSAQGNQPLARDAGDRQPWRDEPGASGSFSKPPAALAPVGYEKHASSSSSPIRGQPGHHHNQHHQHHQASGQQHSGLHQDLGKLSL